MDEHFLAEDLTQDGEIPKEVAFLACRPEDYPVDKHGDWEYLVSRFDFAANQSPDFVRENSRPPLRADQYCHDGINAEWIVYGELLGSQKCSILRLTIRPGVKARLQIESPAVFFTNKGSGKVGGLPVRFNRSMRLGKLYSECGFISRSAIEEPGGVLLQNNGEADFVITLDFPQNSHNATPGT